MTETLADLMADVARSFHERTSADEVLQAIVTTVRETVSGADHVGVSLTERNGRIKTVVASDDLVYQLDTIQYELDEGPCLDAIRDRARAVVNDLARDGRWPRFAPQAVALGVRSQMGVELYSDSTTIGGLNLYGDRAGQFDDETVHIVSLFAAHAAQALGKTMREDHLTRALQTRKTIGQAIGIVMERYHLNQDRAFEFLARVSQQGNRKLAEIAAELVQEVDRKHRPDRSESATDRPAERPDR